MPRHGMTASGTAEPVGGAAPGRRFGLSSWPIRRKLVALVAGPLLVILGAGALVTTQAIGQLREAQDAEKIASAALYSNQLAQALQREVISTMTVVAEPSKGTRIRLRKDRATTDAAFATLNSELSDAPRGGWDVLTKSKIKDIADRRQALAQIRQETFPHGIEESGIKQPADGQAALQPRLVQAGYQNVFEAPRALTERLAQRLSTATSDGSTVNTASTITALAGVSTLAANEIIDVDIALVNGNLPAPARAAAAQSASQQQDLLLIAANHATEDQRSSIAAVSADDARIDGFRSEALDLANNAGDNDNAKQKAAADAPEFVSAAGQRLSNLDDLVAKVVADAQATASQSVRNSLVRVGVVGGGALLLLVLVTAFTAAVARSVSSPLRRLRTAAVETANVRLPAAVAQIDREGPDAQVTMPPALPPDDSGGPETTEVARAVDGLTNEAVRLASAQVRLRRSLDDAFVSMSRRSQSMVEKQLAIIDELERTEEDPDQLRNLFRLDHLAARMRRYNDNLLVLAGSVVRTRTNAPVPIADVFRAATSEMEQYERVRLQPVNGARWPGPPPAASSTCSPSCSTTRPCTRRRPAPSSWPRRSSPTERSGSRSPIPAWASRAASSTSSTRGSPTPAASTCRSPPGWVCTSSGVWRSAVGSRCGSPSETARPARSPRSSCPPSSSWGPPVSRGRRSASPPVRSRSRRRRPLRLLRRGAGR